MVLLVLSISVATPETAQKDEGAAITDSIRAALQVKATAILGRSCAVSWCHTGRRPQAELVLDSAEVLRSILNVSSREISSLMLVDTERPEESYLLMKIKGDARINGERMPFGRRPLEEEEIDTIEQWVESLSTLRDEELKVDPAEQKSELNLSWAKESKERDEPPATVGIASPAFSSTRLINLPTTRPMAKGELLFRVSHRFYLPTRSGYESFYGLDGPAFILLSLGYGLSDAWNITLGRTNLRDEIELSSTFSFFQEGNPHGLPFAAVFTGCWSVTTETSQEMSVFDWDNERLSFQVSLSRQLTDRISFLIVPSFSYNTDYSKPGEENTFGLGIGGRIRATESVSLVGEVIPVLSGYSTGDDAWGLGIEVQKGGHVFHIFLNNTYGLTPNQYLPGGDLQIADRDIRLGFNIYRSFWP
jgi:hypothetical protein